MAEGALLISVEERDQSHPDQAFGASFSMEHPSVSAPVSASSDAWRGVET